MHVILPAYKKTQGEGFSIFKEEEDVILFRWA
jgi:hypothetical protein